MTLVLWYWIVVAGVGFAASLSALWGSIRLSRFLKRERPELVKANRVEIARDLFLVGGLGANTAIGVAAAVSAQLASAKSFAGMVTLIGLLGGATLLSLFACLNSWLRRRT